MCRVHIPNTPRPVGHCRHPKRSFCVFCWSDRRRLVSSQTTTLDGTFNRLAPVLTTSVRRPQRRIIVDDRRAAAVVASPFGRPDLLPDTLVTLHCVTVSCKQSPTVRRTRAFVTVCVSNQCHLLTHLPSPSVVAHRTRVSTTSVALSNDLLVSPPFQAAVGCDRLDDSTPNLP